MLLECLEFDGMLLKVDCSLVRDKYVTWIVSAQPCHAEVKQFLKKRYPDLATMITNLQTAFKRSKRKFRSVEETLKIIQSKYPLLKSSLPRSSASTRPKMPHPTSPAAGINSVRADTKIRPKMPARRA